MKYLKVKGVEINHYENLITLSGCKVYISKKDNDGFEIKLWHPELGYLDSEYWEYYEDAVKDVEESVALQFGDDVLLTGSELNDEEE